MPTTEHDADQGPDAILRREGSGRRRRSVSTVLGPDLRPRDRDAGRGRGRAGPRPGHVREALAQRRTLRPLARQARDVGPADGAILAIDAIRRRVLEVRSLERVELPREADEAPGSRRRGGHDRPHRACQGRDGLAPVRSSERRSSSPTWAGRRAPRSPTSKASRSGRRRRGSARRSSGCGDRWLPSPARTRGRRRNGRGWSVTTCEDVRPLLADVVLDAPPSSDEDRDPPAPPRMRRLPARARRAPRRPRGLRVDAGATGAWGAPRSRHGRPWPRSGSRSRARAIARPCRRDGGSRSRPRSWPRSRPASSALAQFGRAGDFAKDATSFRTVLGTLGGTGFKVGSLEPASPGAAGRGQRGRLRVEP